MNPNAEPCAAELAEWWALDLAAAVEWGDGRLVRARQFGDVEIVQHLGNLLKVARAALVALPPADQPAPPPSQGEDMERGCNAEIWPSWSNRWISCGSVIRPDGKCAKYGHEQRGTETAGPQSAGETEGRER